MNFEDACCPSGMPEPPQHYCCPITQELMETPVVCQDGFTYEQRAIEVWMTSHRNSSPMTNLPMDNIMTPNHALRTAIAEFRENSSAPSGDEPKYWRKTHTAQITDNISLQSAEGTKICALFRKTLGRHSGGDIEVVRIERNQNTKLWRRYAAFRRIMSQDAPTNCQERYMFHGPSSEEVLTGILDMGVDPVFSKGGPCGFGAYFANSSCYILQARKFLCADAIVSYESKTESKRCDEKRVFVCRVLLGRTALGEEDMRRPPPNCDSTWQYSVGGRVHCLFDRAQSYPEYIVTFAGSPAPVPSSASKLPSSSIVVPWLRQRGFTIVHPNDVTNPIIELEESPDHPCTVVSTRSRGIIKGKHIGANNLPTGEFAVFVDSKDDSLQMFQPSEIIIDDSVSINPPWLDKGVVVRSSEACAPLLQFLRGNVDGLHNNWNLGPVTFLDVFLHYRLHGVCLLFFGGAVRHALLNDFAGIKDGDCTYGASAGDMVRVGQSAFGPVEENSGRVIWGTGTTVMEGKAIRGESSSSNCYVIDDNTRVISNNLFDNLIHADFACNTVLFDPTEEVFIDPSGFGIFDIQNHILRIPVCRDKWEVWIKCNPTKILRYWKMRQMSYIAEDQDTHDFIITGAVREGLMDDIPSNTRQAFVLHQICRGREPRAGAREWVLQALAEFRTIVVNDINAFNARVGNSSITGADFWGKYLAPDGNS